MSENKSIERKCGVMFCKISRNDVISIWNHVYGKGTPNGDVYINTDRINFIDGDLIYVRNYIIHCREGIIDRIVAGGQANE